MNVSHDKSIERQPFSNSRVKLIFEIIMGCLFSAVATKDVSLKFLYPYVNHSEEFINS